MAAGRSIKAGEAYVLISLRDQLTKGLKRLSGGLTSFGRQATRVGAGVMAGALATGALFMPAIAAASDAQETMSKFGVVFGEQSDAAKAWADSFAEEVGRSKREIAGFMASSQDLFVPLGFDRGAAREMSQELTALAVDLASFNNMSDADALRDLQAALTGSGAVMKKYGVLLNEAAVKQELLTMGMDPANVTEAAKAQARMNIILRGTTDAQGDALRTAGSYANQVKALKATFDDLKVTIGTELLPMATAIVQRMKGGVSAAGEWITENKHLLPVVVKGIAVVAGLGAGILAAGTMAIFAGKAIAGLAVVSGIAFTVLAGGVSILLGPLGVIKTALVTGAVLWTKYSASGKEATQRLVDGMQAVKAIGSETFDGIKEALMEGDLEGAAQIALAGLDAAWREGLARMTESWGGWIQGIVEVFAGAMQEIGRLWIATQGRIAKSIAAMADRDDAVGVVIRQTLGVKSSREMDQATVQRERAALSFQVEEQRRQREEAATAGDTAAVQQWDAMIERTLAKMQMQDAGLSQRHMFGEGGAAADAMESLDQQTADSIAGIEDRIGGMMSSVTAALDPAAAREAADAARERLELTRQERAEQREQARLRKQEAEYADDFAAAMGQGLGALADAAAAGTETAAAVASTGTFGGWALDQVFGQFGDDDRQVEATEAVRDEIVGLRRDNRARKEIVMRG